jgi:hypothetical protein
MKIFSKFWARYAAANVGKLHTFKTPPKHNTSRVRDWQPSAQRHKFFLKFENGEVCKHCSQTHLYLILKRGTSTNMLQLK